METADLITALKGLEPLLEDASEGEKRTLLGTYDRTLKRAIYRILEENGLPAGKARLAEMLGDERFPVIPRIVAGNKVVERLPQPTELRALRESLGLPAYSVANAVGLSVTKYTNFERGELNELDVTTKKYEKTLAQLKKLAKTPSALDRLRSIPQVPVVPAVSVVNRAHLRELLEQGRGGPVRQTRKKTG